MANGNNTPLGRHPVNLGFVLAAATLVADQTDVYDRATHGYAVSDGGVKIHYASLGPKDAAGAPLVVMIHGFPDFWYSWRHQMSALADRFQVVAIDQRGYNLSDKPSGVESYDMRLLAADVAAVIRHIGRDKATIVGHDWGGMVAWQFALSMPQMTENYPKAGPDAPAPPDIPKAKMPVLMFHGLGDTALHSDGLSGTWNWVEKDLTLVTVPGAGHFVQQDAAELVTTTMRWWLTARTTR